MSKAIENLIEAQKYAMSIRPKIGGFPYFAEALRVAGVKKNIWSLPSCQSLYLTEYGEVMMQGTPLCTGMTDVASFDSKGLILALRADQAGNSTFPEFLQAAWAAGVVGYTVDLEKRNVSYFGGLGEVYVEEYPTVDLNK